MYRFLFPFLVVTTASLTGCSETTAPISSDKSKYQAGDESDSANSNLDTSDLPNGAGSPSETPSPVVQPSIAEMESPSSPMLSVLPPMPEDASTEDAMAYIQKANQALADLIQGRTEFVSAEQSRAAAKHISFMKRDAASNTLKTPDLADEAIAILKRSKLEALSQLAGLQDVSAANELETFAKELLDDPNQSLANDGRVVQLGFAMERLRSGQAKNPDEIIQQVTDLAKVESELGIPAFLAMRQCYIGLRQYEGYGDQAREIRTAIVDKFANHSESQIQLMVNELKTSARFDEMDAFQEQLRAGDEIDQSEFVTAIKNLIANPDGVGLQYMSSLALAAEQSGKDEIAKTVFAEIASGYQGENVPVEIAAEAKVFVAASTARSNIIGKPLQIAYPDLSGVAVDWNSYRGSVVLMPFWQSSPPQSLFSVLPLLNAMRKQFPDKVKLLGVNLDTVDEELAVLRNQAPLDFPNIRNPDIATRGFKDPLAQEVGFATYPFIVAVDGQGVVRHILMGLRPDFQDLIAELVSAEEQNAKKQ